MSRSELKAYFDDQYTRATLHYVATHWDPNSKEIHLEEVLDQLFSVKDVKGHLTDLSEPSRAVLGQLAAAGGRIRGESLRRDLLLRGFGETASYLRELIARALVFCLPATGEYDLDVETLLEADSFLQRELAITEPLAGELEGETLNIGPAALQGFEGTIAQTSADSVEVLEINLLHLSTSIEREGLRLNKSGVPNRRSLGRIAQGLIFPEGQGEAGEELDLNDAVQLDYISFLLALALEMDMVVQEGAHFSGHPEGREHYFRGNFARRHRLIMEGLQNLRFWSELESLALTRQRSATPSGEQFSQRENTGEGFIGARGYVVSVLRRARLAEWIPLDALIELCISLDRSYLRRALDRAAEGIESEEFLEALFRRTLAWAGIVELGESDDGMELARFTPRGRMILGLDEDPAESVPEGPCLIVQPNFEVMVFLDAASLSLLYDLYRIGERTRLSERVATFRLTAESVQRGFSQGHEAETLINTLSELSHAPLPESVAFQLRDWERVHRNVEIFAPGYLIRHRDEDQFDLHLGQLEHDLEEGTTILRLGPQAAFVVTNKAALLTRFVERHKGTLFSYDDTPPVPCIYFVDPLTMMIDPLHCDIISRSEIGRISRHLEDEDSEENLFFELDPGLIRARWPEDPLQSVITFLDPRVEGGIPPEEALRLQSMLLRAPQSRILDNVTVLVVDDADVAQRLAEVEDARTLIVERLGDRAFAIDAKHREELELLLDELGFERDT
ncbi:MAG: helicase-associated domain-containing protein [Bradymonadaceae bacterium]